MKEYIFFVIYNGVVIPLLFSLSRFGAFINKKLARRVKAEKTFRLQLAQLAKGNKRYWFHASSSGEFEQVKPIIEHLKQQEPQAQIIVTFFSPSGLDAHHTYPLADLIFYLPLDTIHNAQLLLSTIQPRCLIIARYDLWWNILRECSQLHIPIFLVCATLNNSSMALRIPLIKSMYLMMYSWLTVIYTAGTNETEKFIGFGIDKNLITAADTRFDRIISVVSGYQQRSPNLLPPNWFQPNDIIMVLGSSWEEDEKIVFLAAQKAIQKGFPLKLIITPHAPETSTIQKTQNYYIERFITSSPPVFLSEVQNMTPSDNRWGTTIIVDSIGHLLSLYSYAAFAFIGGGFGAGVHSVTEPAGYGIPLACGPNIQRARDAQFLKERQALTVIHNAEECFRWLLMLLTDKTIYQQYSQAAYDYIHQNTSWSDRISKDILSISK